MHTARNANLQDIVGMLRSQRVRQLDVVAPATAMRFRDGVLHVDGTEPVLTDDGVSTTTGVYAPTAVFDEGVAAKLNVPVGYLRRMREERPDLYDANVNGWLHGRRPKVLAGTGHTIREGIAPDSRAFLLRLLRADETEQGIARAMLSDSYKVMDNLDVLLSALDGIREAGVAVDVTGADLTDRRMYVRVRAPQVEAYAPELLRGYRSPFTGALGVDNPRVFAGFELSNSETGGGALAITPRIEIEICANGMKMTKDVLRAVHLGGRLESGVVNWSAETQQRAVALVKSKTTDAVRTFLDVEYVQRAVRQLEEKASEPIASVDEVKVVTKALNVPQAHIDGLLSYFVQGGQMTRAGVANAMTAYSQTLDDADAAAELEEVANRVLV